jgi:protease I
MTPDVTIDSTGNLAGKRIAILATNGFEQAELLVPQQTLEDAGATVDVIAPEPGLIQGMIHQEKGQMVAVDLTLEEANPEDYDVLVLPGGVANPDALRQVKEAIDFIEYFNETGRLVAAICHGPWSLIEADMVKGRTVTSWPSLKTDLRNAGAAWVDQEVVVDGNLITSRKPADLEAFCEAIIETLTASDLAEEAA